MEKALVLLSGGLDSAVALAMAIAKHGKENVTGLSIFYGQRHDKELSYANALAAHYQIPRKQLDLSTLFYDENCSLLASSTLDIPEEEYAELHQESNKPISTYVPFRNGLFLSVATSIALQEHCSVIYYGIHDDEGPESAYPDTSEAFHKSISAAIAEGSGHLVRLEAPFIGLTKADIVKKGIKLKVPFEKTWSCYNEGAHPCGKCPTCLDRAKAFAANGIEDPLIKGVTWHGRIGA